MKIRQRTCLIGVHQNLYLMGKRICNIKSNIVTYWGEFLHFNLYVIEKNEDFNGALPHNHHHGSALGGKQVTLYGEITSLNIEKDIC